MVHERQSARDHHGRKVGKKGGVGFKAAWSGQVQPWGPKGPSDRA